LTVRVACVHAPQLALQAVLRRARVDPDHPVILADTPGERARVVALTGAARRAGVCPGTTVSQARAAASGALGPGRPALQVFVSSAADTAAARAALADVAYGFAARVQAGEDDRVFFEAGDLGRMFPAGERAIAQAVAAAAARVGLAVRVAIAGSKSVARVATSATGGAGIAIVPEGGARAFLEPLAIEILGGNGDGDGDGETLDKLRRWGVRTLGALARLPLPDVSLRLGSAGTLLWHIASGSHDDPLLASPPPDAIEEGTELDHPIYELEPLAFVLRGLLERATGRLELRGLGCAGFTLRVKLEPRGFEVIEVPMAAPTRETAIMLQLARLAIARRPPGAPVAGLALLVRPARVRAAQMDLLRPSGPAPERLATTLARLAALVGVENVGIAGPVDSHREEAISIAPGEVASFTSEAKSNDTKPGAMPAAGMVALIFRRFRPPHELEVLIDRDEPVALRGKDTTARILVAAGPYRVNGDWWSGDGFNRDYWDVQASDGAVYRLHRDCRDQRWYLDGYYD
jgi:protein ImuB